MVLGGLYISARELYVRKMNGFYFSAKFTPKTKDIPLRSLQLYPASPDSVEDTKKWDTFQPTEKIDLDYLDENE